MSLEPEFRTFPKIPRYSRECIVTEKIDGKSAVVHVTEDGDVRAGSRLRWITPADDNHGFAAWVEKHQSALATLGPGYHFGEWWGQGINRGYGLKEKRFSLFNVTRRDEERPSCCSLVPIIWRGDFDYLDVAMRLEDLAVVGSYAVPGFMRPEGIVIYHVAGNVLFKKTIEKDYAPKGAER